MAGGRMGTRRSLSWKSKDALRRAGFTPSGGTGATKGAQVIARRDHPRGWQLIVAGIGIKTYPTLAEAIEDAPNWEISMG